MIKVRLWAELNIPYDLKQNFFNDLNALIDLWRKPLHL
jgi:hypothetical protein